MKKTITFFVLSIFMMLATNVHAEKIYDYVVAQDGTGDFTTLKEAITASDNNGTTIFIKKGTYREKVDITKKNITLIGQNAENVIFVWNDSGAAVGTSESFTIRVNGENFYAENITISNNFGVGSQAVALSVKSDKAAFKNCRLLSFQDTHYVHSSSARQYYKDCFIEGGTDFIFGGAIAVFDDCLINCMKGGYYITAPAGNDYDYGLVFRNCEITANSDVPSSNGYLGRPWKDYGKTVWLNCKMGNHIRAVGWSRWTNDTSSDNYDNADTGYYAEYKSTDLTGKLISTSSRASWSKQLTESEANQYTLDNIFGNKGYSTKVWNPLPTIESPEKPVNLKKEENQLSWDAVANAKGYVITRNSEVIGFTTTTSFTDESADEETAYIYFVQAIGATGNLSEKSIDIYPVDYQTGDALIDEHFNSQTWINNATTAALTQSVFVPVSVLGITKNFEITVKSQIFPERAVAIGSTDSSEGAIYLEKPNNNSYIVLPELPNCANVTAIWCLPNLTNRTLKMEKYENGAWKTIVEGNADTDKRQGILTYDFNTESPVTLRFSNGNGTGAIYLHDLKVTAYKSETGSAIKGEDTTPSFLSTNTIKDYISLNNIEQLKSITIYSLSGQIIKSTPAMSTIDVSNLINGYYIIQLNTKDGKSIREKIVKI